MVCKQIAYDLTIKHQNEISSNNKYSSRTHMDVIYP
jgi:hypothetical protein